MPEVNFDSEYVKSKLSHNKIIGRDIFYFSKTESTMDEAHKIANTKQIEGAVFIAEEQAFGRGRFSRKWISDAGVNLTFSILLRPDVSKMRFINMASALAIANGVFFVTGLESTLKWPNDVRIKKMKVAGILIESRFDKYGDMYMVLGIGINVNMRIEQHAEIKSLATSLFNESGKSVSRIDLFVAILNSLDVFYQNLDCSDEIRNEWTSKLDTLGMDINFLIGESIIEGRAESVDEEGNLIVRKKDGELVTYSAGEITLQT